MQTEKKQLRTFLRQCRRALTPTEVTEKSHLITQRMFTFTPFQQAATVVLYNADENEVVTEAIWQMAMTRGQAVYYPRITPDKADLEFVRRYPGERLVPGMFNILIPQGNEVLSGMQPSDIVLTPGVGFDENGHRLGRGKGYYDRAFRGVLASALRVALAYDLQVVPKIPSGPMDELVHWIVTESRLIECSSNTER
jgi:5-formyltetrahydrofolate cyclo-ligase